MYRYSPSVSRSASFSFASSSSLSRHGVTESSRQPRVVELGRAVDRRQGHALELRVTLDDDLLCGAADEVRGLAGAAVGARLLERLDQLRVLAQVLDFVAARDDADAVLTEQIGSSVRVVVWKGGKGGREGGKGEREGREGEKGKVRQGRRFLTQTVFVASVQLGTHGDNLDSDVQYPP